LILSQLRELSKINHPEVRKLCKVLQQFRDEEIEHHDIAIENKSRQVIKSSFKEKKKKV